MIKRSFMAVLAILALLLTAAPSYAWLIYYKPAYHGKVIDTETKEPIEGAVVVVVYEKKTLGPVESEASEFNARETLTDKNGEFHFSPYLTIINPLSWTFVAHFIIYKPGYGYFPGTGVYFPVMDLNTSSSESVAEVYFSSALFGQTKEVPLLGKTHLVGNVIEHDKATVTFGIVGLPKLKTIEERRRMPGPPAGFTWGDLPLLRKAVNEERKSLGLNEIN